MQVYVLKSLIAKRFYVGMTMDAYNRLAQHNAGMTRSTKYLKPWIIVHVEEFPDAASARRREKYLKSGAGRRYLKGLNL